MLHLCGGAATAGRPLAIRGGFYKGKEGKRLPAFPIKSIGTQKARKGGLYKGRRRKGRAQPFGTFRIFDMLSPHGRDSEQQVPRRPDCGLCRDDSEEETKLRFPAEDWFAGG